MAGMRGETLLRPIVAFGIGAKAGLVDDGLVPKETSTPRAGSAVILSPMSDTEQMTLILKHANKNRLGAIDWTPTISMAWLAIGASIEHFCRCRHRKVSRGSGQ